MVSLPYCVTPNLTHFLNSIVLKHKLVFPPYTTNNTLSISEAFRSEIGLLISLASSSPPERTSSFTRQLAVILLYSSLQLVLAAGGCRLASAGNPRRLVNLLSFVVPQLGQLATRAAASWIIIWIFQSPPGQYITNNNRCRISHKRCSVSSLTFTFQSSV